MHDEDFDNIYGHFGGLYALEQQGGAVVGMLGMDIPHLNLGHIVAVDELGVVDPADNAHNHVPLVGRCQSRDMLTLFRTASHSV